MLLVCIRAIGAVVYISGVCNRTDCNRGMNSTAKLPQKNSPVSNRKLGVHIYSFSRQKCYVMQIIPRVCVFCKSYEPAALSPAYSACCDKEWGGRDGWVGSTHPGTNNYLVRSCTITYKPFWAWQLFTLPLWGVLIALQWGESARSLGVTVASESLLTGFPQVHPEWICYRTTILW